MSSDDSSSVDTSDDATHSMSSVSLNDSISLTDSDSEVEREKQRRKKLSSSSNDKVNVRMWTKETINVQQQSLVEPQQRQCADLNGEYSMVEKLYHNGPRRFVRALVLLSRVSLSSSSSSPLLGVWDLVLEILCTDVCHAHPLGHYVEYNYGAVRWSHDLAYHWELIKLIGGEEAGDALRRIGITYARENLRARLRLPNGKDTLAIPPLTIFHIVALSDDVWLLKRLHTAGLFPAHDVVGHLSLLHIACATGAVATARFLIEEGLVDVLCEFDGVTPLMWAARYGQPRCLALLLSCGLDVGVNRIHRTKLTTTMNTPLHFLMINATTHGGTEESERLCDCIRLLRSHGCDETQRNAAGMTAYAIACQKGLDERVLGLL
eukprot:PhM_4_TR17568/c0_g1_i1/m.88371